MPADLSPDILFFAVCGLLALTPRLTRAVRRTGSRTVTTREPQQRRPADRARRDSRPPAPAFPTVTELSGKAHIIDGDTVVIKGTKVRLAGIDAPELDRPFGQKSKWTLIEICKGQIVTAKFNGETSHDRFVGTCYLPDGRDIGAELILRGLALDWPRFSGGKYRNLEPPGARQKLRNRQGW